MFIWLVIGIIIGASAAPLYRRYKGVVDGLWKRLMARVLRKKPQAGMCGLCGLPMPPGEEVFKYHGYSGPCPTP